jgi:hypothetical protein
MPKRIPEYCRLRVVVDKKVKLMELKREGGRLCYNIGDGWSKLDFPPRFLTGAIDLTYQKFCANISEKLNKKVKYLNEIRIPKTLREFRR